MAMSYRLKTAATDDVVSLAEIKAHCRVDHNDDDVMLAQMVKAAVSHFEAMRGILGICLAQQVWELYLDAFPVGELKIELPPIVSIDTVEYIAPDGTDYTTWAGVNYGTDTKGHYGWVVPVDTWPDTKDTINAVRVTFTAGFTTDELNGVAASLKIAVMLLAAHWYANRETVSIGNTTSALPFTVDALIAQWKEWRV